MGESSPPLCFTLHPLSESVSRGPIPRPSLAGKLGVQRWGIWKKKRNAWKSSREVLFEFLYIALYFRISNCTFFFLSSPLSHLMTTPPPSCFSYSSPSPKRWGSQKYIGRVGVGHAFRRVTSLKTCINLEYCSSLRVLNIWHYSLGGNILSVLLKAKRNHDVWL